MKKKIVIVGGVAGGATWATRVGGGFIGLEMAENLAHRGIPVTVVELANQVLPPTSDFARRPPVCTLPGLYRRACSAHLVPVEPQKPPILGIFVVTPLQNTA